MKVPVLANITEFGKTPLFSTAELASANVAMAMMDGTMTAGESEVVAQIATVTAAGTGVEIAIAAMTGTVGVESRRIRVD